MFYALFSYGATSCAWCSNIELDATTLVDPLSTGDPVDWTLVDTVQIQDPVDWPVSLFASYQSVDSTPNTPPNSDDDWSFGMAEADDSSSED
jgi:hypothetical protein